MDVEEGALETVTVHVKYGKEVLDVSMDCAATVQDLMAQLQRLTNVNPRGQKLIFKGRILDSNTSLVNSNVLNGSKIMLMASQGIHQGGSLKAKQIAPSHTPKISSKLKGHAHIRLSNTVLGKNRIDTWRATGIISLGDLDIEAAPDDIWSIGAAARVLDLGGNRLDCVSTKICSLVNLQKLRLSGNQLSNGQIPWSSLISLKNLSVLAFDHNQLTDIPSEVGCFSSLKQLLVSHNKLEFISEDLGKLLKLEKLDLSNNYLQELPSSLGNCLHLIEMNISANVLKDVPSTLGNLQCLKVLLLDNNGLKAIPDEILRGCSELSTLSLHGNELTIEDLRKMESWREFDERRKSKYSKQLDFNVMGSSSGFDEGADAEQWHHW